MKDDKSIVQHEQEIEAELKKKGLGKNDWPNPKIPSVTSVLKKLDKKAGLTYDKGGLIRLDDKTKGRSVKKVEADVDKYAN